MPENYVDFGFVTAGEMHRIMADRPELHFTLRVDSDTDGEEADLYDPTSPMFQAWKEDQVPTDDFQRPMRLEGRYS